MVFIGLSSTTLNSSRCALVAWGSGISTVTGLGLFIEGSGSGDGSGVDSEDGFVSLVSGSCSIFVGPVGP